MLAALAAVVLQTLPAAPQPLLASAPAARGATEPRLLLVDIDDVGFDLVQETPTPTLDWIAAHGRSFTRFVTAPLCSPTRAMVMTGAYPSHPDLLIGSVSGFNETYSMPIAPLEPLPALLGAYGGSSAKGGKRHLAAADHDTHPNECGWGSYQGLRKNPEVFALDWWNFPKVVDGVSTRVLDRYMTTDETEDAIAHVRDGVRFVSLSYHAPHTPFHEPPAHLHTISPLASARDLARALLQAVATEFGRLLREAIARQYTVIVFSDNGTVQALGGGKGTLFDTGILAPMWAVGPGVVQGVDDDLVSAVDVYATVAEFFGITAGPPHRGQHSRSFLARLGGAREPRRWAYSERFANLGQDPRVTGIFWRRMVRGDRYKLIDIQNGAGESFFDLWANPSETYDLLQGPPLSPEAAAALAHFRRILDRL